MEEKRELSEPFFFCRYNNLEILDPVWTRRDASSFFLSFIGMHMNNSLLTQIILRSSSLGLLSA